MNQADRIILLLSSFLLLGVLSHATYLQYPNVISDTKLLLQQTASAAKASIYGIEPCKHVKPSLERKCQREHL